MSRQPVRRAARPAPTGDDPKSRNVGALENERMANTAAGEKKEKDAHADDEPAHEDHEGADEVAGDQPPVAEPDELDDIPEPDDDDALELAGLLGADLETEDPTGLPREAFANINRRARMNDGGVEDPTGLGYDASDPLSDPREHRAAKRRPRPAHATCEVMQDRAGWDYLVLNSWTYDGIDYVLVWPKHGTTVEVKERAMLETVEQAAAAAPAAEHA